jgi:hypothetical protein
MARKITNQLKKEEVIKYLDVALDYTNLIENVIDNNWGRDPIMYRRAGTIVQKIEELKELVEERDSEYPRSEL